ncbi:MAG: sugar ABC transporter permease [Pseudomonadales bacterium]
MKHRSFFWFMLPSALAMLVFIAAPIVSVVIQSVYAPHEQVIKVVESCSIFGCTESTTVDQEATRALRDAEPLGRFVGNQIYTDRNHLATEEIAVAWSEAESFGEFFDKATNLPFYNALSFTLTYTAVVTPMAIIIGFFIALGVNNLPKILRGPSIFFSLLPMIVTPLVGALILFWMIDSRGVLGVGLQNLLDDPTLSLKASTPMMWVTLIVYGIWSSCPFAFVVYYAGLQTVPQDSIESAKLDGASRWQQIWHIVIPHLVPLTTFMALIKIMDNFRVFEPIVSFNAQAHAQSLSSFIYSDLGGETQLLSSAAATSVLTIIGVVILLSPVLVRTYRDYGNKR